MQVLLYVSTLIMVFAILSYGKLQSIKGLAVLKEKAASLRESSGLYFNRRSEYYYDTTQFEGSPGNKQSNSQATRFINLSCLFKEQEVENGNNFTKDLIKELIDHLYSEQTFYKDLIQIRPNFVLELLERLIEEVKTKDKAAETRIKRIDQLANLDLKDAELSSVLFHMLKGFEGIDKKGESIGYPPLLDFITLEGNGAIRVWLAPKPILDIVFDNEGTAFEVEANRLELHKRITQGLDQKEATQIFKDAFERRARPNLPLNKLDFQVSTQKPGKTSKRNNAKKGF